MSAVGCDGGKADSDLPTVSELVAATERRWQRTEEIVEQCMREHGFDYVQRPLPGGAELPPPEEDRPERLFEISISEQQARESGFGVTDRILETASGEPTAPDPNRDVVEALPEREADAWREALHGNPGTGEEGCLLRGEMQAREETDDDVGILERNVRLVSERIKSDERTAELWAEWAECMANEGIYALNLEELIGDFSDEATEIRRHAMEPQKGVDGALVEDLREREIHAAVVAARCFAPLEHRWDEIVADAVRDGGP